MAKPPVIPVYMISLMPTPADQILQNKCAVYLPLQQPGLCIVFE
jgi:hypothetical protein